MARYDRDQVILGKAEGTYGVDAVPTGANNSLLVSNVKCNPLKAQTVPRDFIRNYFGANEELIGDNTVSLSYDVDVSGSGAAGTAPKWAPWLMACGFAEVVSAGNRVDYTPITNGQTSLTQYYHDSGVLKKMLGARGNWSLDLGIGKRPLFGFEFEGLDGLDTAVANATPDYTGFQKPKVVTDANTGDILLGCTYSAGALSGGTAYPSRGLTLDGGNTVEFLDLLTGNSVDITNREVKGKVMFDLTAAQEVTFLSNIRSGTLQSLGVVQGTAAGNKVLVHMPNIQLINPTKETVKGRRLLGFDIIALPLTGNDEIRLVVL